MRTLARALRAHPDWGAGAFLLALTIILQVLMLFAEAAVAVPYLNDGVLHLANLRDAARAISQGGDPTDTWLGEIALGYPLFHHYQHLPYLLPGLLVALTRGALAAEATLRWATYLLLCAFPIGVFWSARRLGLERSAALLAGAAGSLLATPGLYGMDATSYLWGGYGLYTQLWGMWFLTLGLGQGVHTLRTGRGYLGSAILVAGALLSHVVFGYILVLSLGAAALVSFLSRKAKGGEPRGAPIGRLIVLGAFVALACAYFLVPFWRDRAYMNRSVWEYSWKYDSFGLPWVLTTLLKGQLFDANRFPGLTLLVLLGGILCFVWWDEERYRFILIFTLLWLLLYGGRPTWGALLNLLPLSRDLHFHRLIGGVHLGGIYLIGIGLSWVWQVSRRLKGWRGLLIPAVVTAGLLVPAYRERFDFWRQKALWKVEARQALAAEREDLDALFGALRSLPPGRVYAGLPAKWGKEVKVGAVPLYALLTDAGFDTLGYLYHALSLNADVMVLFHDGIAEQYNLFNVRYVITPQGWSVPSFYTVLGDFGRFRLYGVETSGYFDLVDASASFAGPKEAFYGAASAWLGSGWLAAKDHPIIYLGKAPKGESAEPLEGAAERFAMVPTAPSEPLGEILSERVGDGAYQAFVRLEREGFLMLKVAYHPNWRVDVDGARAEAVMMMPSYLGIRLGPGLHEVRCIYQPSPGRGLLGLVGLLALALLGWAERHKQGEFLWEWVGRRWASLWGRAKFASNFNLSSLLYLFGVLAMVLLVGLPLFQGKMPSGHDAPEYITRAVEFYYELRAGHLFPRWAPDLNFGYGEPFFNFNPPLIYYAMSLFRALTGRFVIAQNLASFLLLLVAGVGMYLFMADLGSKRSAFIAAVAYLFAPYFLCALYVRQALADFSAFAPLPYAFWGVYLVATGKRRALWWVGIAAVSLLMLSSNPVALMAIPSLVLWSFWLGWRARYGKAFLRGFGVILAGLSLSAFFWLPAFAERNLVQTARLFEGYLNYRNHFVYPSQFISLSWGYGLSVAGPKDGMSFSLGPVHLLGIAVTTFFILGNKQVPRGDRAWHEFFLILCGGAVFLASTLSRSLWDALRILQYLEFPWRFLTLAAFSSACLLGGAFHFLERFSPRVNARLIYGTLIAVVGLLLIWGVPKARPERFIALNESHHSPRSIATLGIWVTTAGEYTPIWVQERPSAPAGEPLSLVEGKGVVHAAKVSSISKEFLVEIYEESRLRLNTFYFPGWTLYVNGTERPITYDNPQGVMEFTLPPGRYEVTFIFRDTPIRLWGQGLSLATLGLLLGLALGRRHPRIKSLWERWLTAQPHEAALFVESQPVAQGTEEQSFRYSPKPRVGLGLYLLFLAIYLLSTAGHFFSTDHIATYLTAKSLVERRELAIEKPINDAVLGRDGKYYTVFGLGQSLAVIPLYLLGKGVEHISSPEVRRYFAGVNLGDWGGTVPIFFASLLNQLLTPLTVVMVLRFSLRLGYSLRRSLVIACVFGLATATWVYARDSFQHPLEALLLLLAVYLLYTHRGDLRLRWVLLAGCSFAGAVLTRVNALLIYPAVGAYLAYFFYAQRQGAVEGTCRWGGLPFSAKVRHLWVALWQGGAIKALAVFTLPIALVLGFDFYINFYRFGNIFAFHPHAQAVGLSTPLWTGLYGNLFSLGRSIFLYSPPIALAFWSAKAFWRAHRAEALLFGAIIAIYLVGYSVYGFWSGGWAWGPRFFVATLPYGCLVLAEFPVTKGRRIALAAAAALGVWMQVLGIAVNYSYVYWEWIRMGVSSGEPYLFVPAISPPAMHWRSLLAGRNIDLWLIYVYRAFGAETLALTLATLLGLLGAGLYMLVGRTGWHKLVEGLKGIGQWLISPSDLRET